MAGTRKSARVAEQGQSASPPSTSKKGTKRKAGDDASPSKAKKEQKTLEETVQSSEPVGDGIEDAKMKEAEGETNGEATEDQPQEKNALEEVKADEGEAGATSKPEESKNAANGDAANGDAANGDAEATAVEEDEEREKAQPSNILEKGIIYFFTRGRVGTDDPNSVQDIQRSFFVLRPLPAGAKLTDGAIQDVGNNRLIALPKKVWPKSGRDRFMAFVEKSKTSMDELKETFFQGSDYSTKTTGTRHTPEVTPIGEGVYALTASGDGQTTTHLTYMLTIPQEIGEVQKDIGLAEKGSFILSTKNPEGSAPSYALPATAEYPKEILEEFGSRGWLPTKPEHINYQNASFLLIGESIDSGSALEPATQDQKKEEKEVPEEELIKLEEEDEERIKNLKGDKTIFEDLGISSKEYPKVKSTW
ncbi:Hypothetical predicted protein [Lecanosticta acicola]|uniref:BTB domain transcription factor n=1 Tax=Lecanosticta acicola TaxID=111012 RepID=A0AAI9E6W4_9PEZI|nr:Hypothetical predicted protein [Lecanosticta acicola]